MLTRCQSYAKSVRKILIVHQIIIHLFIGFYPGLIPIDMSMSVFIITSVKFISALFDFQLISRFLLDQIYWLH